jgi:hypothetical protein
MADDKPNVIVQTPNGGIFGTANRTIGALTNTPILLVMVLLNLGFLAVAAYYLRGQQSGTITLLTQVFDRCLPDIHPQGYILPKPPQQDEEHKP